jgi:hypothetical protein
MPGTVFLPPATVIVPVAGVVGLPAMVKVNDGPMITPGTFANMLPVAGVTGDDVVLLLVVDELTATGQVKVVALATVINSGFPRFPYPGVVIPPILAESPCVILCAVANVTVAVPFVFVMVLIAGYVGAA